jgi:hypothetical protein
VLNLPDGCICTDHVERVAQHLIDQRVSGISPVDSVVHHAHPNASHPEATNDKTGKQLPCLGDKARDYGNYRQEVNHHHDNRLDDHFFVCKLGFLFGFEVRVNSTS